MEEIIIDNLIEGIKEGRYKAEEKLPSDNELAAKYNVPRMRVRKAYEKLEDMGYVYSLQGRGRFVKNKKKKIELIISGNESFSKKIVNKGHTLESKIVSFERVPYNKKIYYELNVDREEWVFKVSRLRIVDSEPIAIHTSYVSKKIFGDIAEQKGKISSMFEYYKSKGYTEFTAKESILSISYPTASERKLLDCTSLVPLLMIETNCKDKETERVLEYTEIIYRGDSFKYII